MRPTRILLATALLAAVAADSRAQVASKKALTLAGARQAIAAAVAEARAKGAPGGVVAVVDDGGNLMALERLDGTFAAGAKVSVGKARTAVLFKRPTKFFEDVVNKGRTVMVALEDFTPLQGGVPIVVDGEVVGGIGVSGAASAAQDEELALAGAAALGGASAPAGGATPARAVTYLPASQVSAAFAKGVPLVEVENYKVHASRREGRPGLVEVHEKDTDVIHVLTGTASVVTGGTVVGGKTIAPEEVRGTSVEGGETRNLSPGDVLIVPNGTPHWFKEVPGPLTYYVVKVRAEGR